MKIYIYPTYTPSRDHSGNLYIKYFHDAYHADKEYKVVNRLWQIGITSILFNLDAKVFIIQWVDLIPGKRLGKLQFIFYLLFVGLARLLGKKVVWLLHNKHAHNGNSKLVDVGMAYMAKMATSVFAHSEEGIRFFDSMYPKYVGKCSYIPHPVYTSEIYESKTPEYDFIIWGGISRRKMVAEFLHAANQMPFFKEKKILIAGKCGDKEYLNEINNELRDNMTFLNRFLSDDELRDYISRSRCVLFTYNADSMLSSGALIYSLNFCKPIIGPNVGSFADFKGIVSVYNTFEDIPSINLEYSNLQACKDYVVENKWETLPKKISDIL